MGLINRFFVIIGWCVVGLGVLGLVAALVMHFTKSSDDSALHAKTERAVAVVELTGEMISAEEFSKSIQDAVRNDKIKAIVVRIDSPGGSVGAAEEMFREIRNASAKKPVTCSMGSVAASGGLFAAMGCKRIWANSGTLTGSIGVILMMPNFHTIMQTFGLGMTVVKSGPFKDSGSPFREVTVDDQQVLQGVVDLAYNQFVEVIASSRTLPAEEVRKFADGRILLGGQAVEIGLIDAIGGVSDAAQAALTEAGLTGEPELVRIKKRRGLMKLLEESASLPLVRLFRSVTELRLMYL